MTRVEQAASLHFNRFWGGYLLDPVQFPQHTQANEGGAPFVNYDLNTLNPTYFQWMDRRVAYCNEHGIIPDISLADLNADFMAKVSEPQLSQLWRYVLARYAAFDVNWNLFGLSTPQTYPASADLLIGASGPPDTPLRSHRAPESRRWFPMCRLRSHRRR